MAGYTRQPASAGLRGVDSRGGRRETCGARPASVPADSRRRTSDDATIIGLRRIKPGAASTTRLDTVDESGALVCRTYQLGISRDVDVIGNAPDIERVPDLPQLNTAWSDAQRFTVPVEAGAAHVYTECARIWNPIHTDRKVALAAGLPDIILHGTATLALAVSRLVDHYLGADPTRVRRLGGRFTAMVLMPSTLTLEVFGNELGTLFFRVLTEDGQQAFSQGFLIRVIPGVVRARNPFNSSSRSSASATPARFTPRSRCSRSAMIARRT